MGAIALLYIGTINESLIHGMTDIISFLTAMHDAGIQFEQPKRRSMPLTEVIHSWQYEVACRPYLHPCF